MAFNTLAAFFLDRRVLQSFSLSLSVFDQTNRYDHRMLRFRAWGGAPF